MYRTHGRKSGFTLIEILIVVIILGILAAIVIPQFSNASNDARKSSLASTVQTLRSQVALYKLQHGDALPDLVTNWNPMMTVTSFGTATNLGPYMQSIPVNPLIQNAAINTKVLAGNGDTTTTGWTAGAYVYDFGTPVTAPGSGKVWGVDNAGNVIAP
jgi:general secretion pathway protein G